MPAAAPTIPAGLRVYAIGDMHGSLDLLKQLREKIDADARGVGAKTQIILLGDYIDRGLQSREVIDYLIAWQVQEKNPLICLLGNHEQVMRSVLNDKDEELLESWLRFGGRETLLSYGVKPAFITGDKAALIEELAEKVPASHRDFLDKLQLSAVFGDYFFCHAGVKPGVATAQQEEDDLVWIRYEFLEHDAPYDKMVVHGHSISLEAEFRANRIGIDTGAYATGKLTALGLEGTKQWLLQTE